MREELIEVAKQTGILPIPYPTMVFSLAPDMYREQEDGNIELVMSFALARIFAKAMLRACEEKEGEITALALVE